MTSIPVMPCAMPATDQAGDAPYLECVEAKIKRALDDARLRGMDWSFDEWIDRKNGCYCFSMIIKHGEKCPATLR